MQRRFLSRDGKAIVCLLALYICGELRINPVGDFPLNDDWSYGLGVQYLLNGHLHLVSWGLASLVAQMIWGWIFCLPLGFSFTALRLSTLVLNFIGIAYAYKLLRFIGKGWEIAFLGAAMLMVNPLSAALSNGFMTDIPAWSLLVIALYYLIRSQAHRSRRDFILATVFCMLGTLVRQFDIALPIAFVACYALYTPGRTAASLFRASVPLLVCGASLLLFNIWIGVHDEQSRLIADQYSVIKNNILASHLADFLPLWDGLRSNIGFIGLFFLPVFLYSACQLVIASRRAHPIRTFALIGLFLLALFAGADGREWLPGNVITLHGIGPFYPFGEFILGANTSWIVNFLSRCGCLLFALLAIIKLSAQKGKPAVRNIPFALLLTFFLNLFYYFSLGLLLLSRNIYYDRYGLLMIFSGLLVCPDFKKPFARIPFFLCCAVALLYYALSIAVVHDYLAWHRAIWPGLNQLLEEHVALEDIDGGFEFNGLHNYETSGWAHLFTPRPVCYVYGSFAPPEGFDQFRSYYYRSWLFGAKEAYIYKARDCKK